MEATADNVETLIQTAASAVAQDMGRKAPSGSDGIWRFDRLIEQAIGASHPYEFWVAAYRAASARNAGKDTWDAGGYGIVACFCQTRAAYATPGFAEARRKHMT